MRRPHARAITGRIVLLVALSVAVTAAVGFAITFTGPPPFSAPYRVSEIADALAGTPRRGPGPPIEVLRSASAPAAHDGQVRDVQIEQLLADRLKLPASVVRVYSSGWAGPPHRNELRSSNGFVVGVQRSEGWMVVQSRPRPWLTNWHKITLASLTLTLIALTLLGWLIARAITRPLAQLADAADAVRAGQPGAPLSIEGPPEVRRVAEALEAMRGRLVGHVAQRTAMLAAITHDLGTPLTRLAFRVEQLPSPERDKGIADIEEMRAMIASVLEFARGETRPHEPLDLAPLLDALVVDMATTGTPIGLTIGSALPLNGDATALRRLFANLIGNALRYGENVRVDAARDGESLRITVDDDGPGIPARLAETLFDPFVRAEPSRSRDTGGMGLGLAIARNIAEAHGGTITAANRPEGGARFTVELPAR